jgi:hypothetical protein
MKSRTEYVKADSVDDLRKQIESFKKFKSLTQEWGDLAIQYSQLKVKLAKPFHSQEFVDAVIPLRKKNWV